jgi:hypothetical protein
MARKISRAKRAIPKHRKTFFQRMKGNANFAIILILGLIFTFAFQLVGTDGMKTTPYPTNLTTNNPSTPNATPGTTGDTCCDTGSGTSCHLVAGTEILYKGQSYGLLRSNIISGENGAHIRSANTIASNGQAIYINDRSSHDKDSKAGPTCTREKDWYYRGDLDAGTHVCWGVPDDEIILLCSKSNPPGKCDSDKGEALWDAYFRVSDATTPGIPDFIRYCNAPYTDNGDILIDGANANSSVVLGVTAGKRNLQLETFHLTATPIPPTVPPGLTTVASYLTPYCKPAIYLYPEQNMPVNVQVFPIGPMTVTIPKYPRMGWNAYAFTDGSVSVDNTIYDYLYYEAQIPDAAIIKPTEGYVVAKEDLNTFLPSILSKLGLNTKERQQFTDYWTHALPASAYYKIKIIEQSTLDTVTPLIIHPTPKTVIRVTLYFEALNHTEDIDAPTLTPVSRNGFTVVEWGGMFKRDKDHNFTCFM